MGFYLNTRSKIQIKWTLEPSDLYINDLRTALMKFKDLENDVKRIADLNTNIQFEYVEEEPASPKNDGSDHDEPADQGTLNESR